MRHLKNAGHLADNPKHRGQAEGVEVDPEGGVVAQLAGEEIR